MGVLRILVIVLGLCGATWAQNLSPRAFTETFATEFRRSIPSATITRGDLQITVRRPSGSTTINLYNAYNTYSKEPQRLKELISVQLALVATLSDVPARAEAKVDASRIVPVIKDRPWLDEIRGKVLAQTPNAPDLAVEDFNKELVIVYALDDSKRMRFLQADELAGIERDELRTLALENLLRIMPKIQMATNGRFGMMIAGGDYVAGGNGLADCDGHGTAVAGIAAAAEAGTGFAGVAPAAAFDAGDAAPGLSTSRMFTVRTDPSANSSVNTPRRTPPVRPATLGCTRMRPGWLGCTVPSAGRCVNHTVPSVVSRPDVYERGVLLRFETVTTCEPGELAPVIPV